MSLEQFAAKWFAIYYLAVGFLLVGSGIYLILKKEKAKQFLLKASKSENPPRLFVLILKYFLFFTLPGLAFSFLPFSLIELLFTLWSLLLVYIAGIRLVRWEESRTLIRASSEKLSDVIRSSGAIMVSVGLAIFLLAYFVINRASF